MCFVGVQTIVYRINDTNRILENPQTEWIVKMRYLYYLETTDSTKVWTIADETYPIPVKFKDYEQAVEQGQEYAKMEMIKQQADTVYCIVIPD